MNKAGKQARDHRLEEKHSTLASDIVVKSLPTTKKASTKPDTHHIVPPGDVQAQPIRMGLTPNRCAHHHSAQNLLQGPPLISNHAEQFDVNESLESPELIKEVKIIDVSEEP